MSLYLDRKYVEKNFRLPIKGYIDITYRCNNACKHCWIREKEDDFHLQKRELSYGEITELVDQARSAGCREWNVSGGELMVRDDFVDIIKYLRSKSRLVSLNTNGTLISSKIAKILSEGFFTTISLYGATESVHDGITRNPGSFEKVIQALNYLQESDADFLIQIVPLADNIRQFEDMKKLANSITKRWKTSSSWLYLSGNNKNNNAQIIQQRIQPKEVVQIDPPSFLYDSVADKCSSDTEEYFFSTCIKQRDSFHIDPYGMMSFCSFVKDDKLRCDLRQTTFKVAWDEFIPSIAEKIENNCKDPDGCGGCGDKGDCRFCAVYSFLEHGDYSRKIQYLCDIAHECKRYRAEFVENNIRYFEIGGMNVTVKSDKPIQRHTFNKKFEKFTVQRFPTNSYISIYLRFELPDLEFVEGAELIYDKTPWKVFKKNGSYIYVGKSEHADILYPHQVVACNEEHTKCIVYNPSSRIYDEGNLNSLTMLPTDQIIFSRVLANIAGFYVHSAGIIINDTGHLFVGNSGAGKSTISELLRKKFLLLCDDRNIVRKINGEYLLFGTWSHGDIAEVNSEVARLTHIYFLVKSNKNSISIIDNKTEILKKMLSCIIKPMADIGWWDKVLGTVEDLMQAVVFYEVEFDKSEEIIEFFL